MLLFLGSQKGGLGRDRFCDDHVLGPMAPEKRMEPGPRGPWGLGQADGLMMLREDFFSNQNTREICICASNRCNT